MTLIPCIFLSLRLWIDFTHWKLLLTGTVYQVIRYNRCALENALKDSNSGQRTIASGDSWNQQSIIFWNKLKKCVRYKRHTRNKILWQFLKACEIGKYCKANNNFTFQNMSLYPNNHSQEKEFKTRHNKIETFPADKKQGNLEGS